MKFWESKDLLYQPASSQPAFTCSKLTIEIAVVLVSLLLPLNNFTPHSSVSVVNFEHVIAVWDIDICQKYEDMLEFDIDTHDIHPRLSFQTHLNVRKLRIHSGTTKV